MILTVTTVLRAMWRVYPRWAVTYFLPPPFFFKGGRGEDFGGQNSEGGSGYQNEEGGSS